MSYNPVDQKDEVKNIIVKKSHYGRRSKPREPIYERKGKKKKKLFI